MNKLPHLKCRFLLVGGYSQKTLNKLCNLMHLILYVMLLTFPLSVKADTPPKSPQTGANSFTQTQIMRFVNCSNGSIKLIPLNNSFDQLLIVGKKLNVNCLSKLNEEIIEIDKQYFYLVYGSDLGVEAVMPDANRILFKVSMATHVRNILFNIEHEVLIELPDGELEFSENEILVFGQKSFLSEEGAFWFDSALNQYGERISLIDVVGGECIPRKKFSEDFVKILTRDGKETLCVMR